MKKIGDIDSRTPDRIQQIKPTDSEKQKRAEKKVKRIRGFYVHASLYLIINTVITIVKIVGTPYYGENFMGPIWHFSTFATWLFWGIGLALHALRVFSYNPFFNKKWEARQIEKYMNENSKS